MKISKLIEHLKTLDQDKEIVIQATDPTDWHTFEIIGDQMVEDSVCSEDEGGKIGFDEEGWDEEEKEEGWCKEVDCYVIKIDV